MLTYLQLISADFTELSECFHEFGWKQCAAGLRGQGFDTCYERKGAYEFLGYLGCIREWNMEASRELSFPLLYSIGDPVISCLVSATRVRLPVALLLEL